MRKSHIGFTVAALVAGGLVGQANAAVIFSDNFNRPNGNLDTTPGPGELGGLLASNVVMRSQSFEQLITSDQLNMQTSGGFHTAAVRFDDAAGSLGSAPPALWNFASGAAGAAITAAGGMIISFNWTPPDTSADWISFSSGISDFNTQYSVVSPNTDSGIILEDDGVVQEFANGSSAGTPIGFSDAIPTHQVSLEYDFSSWADGTPVNLTATVDGTVAGTESFTWNGNSGAQYMELSTQHLQNPTGELISNFAINTVPEPASLGLLAIGATSLLGRRRRH